MRCDTSVFAGLHCIILGISYGCEELLGAQCEDLLLEHVLMHKTSSKETCLSKNNEHSHFCCLMSQKCGACQHINIPYADQLASKDQYVAQLFADIANPASIRPILGMKHPYYYRNKVASPYVRGRKLAPSKNARTSMRDRARGGVRKKASRYEVLCGMYAAGTHRVVQTDDCLIENQQAKRIIIAVRDLMLRFGIEPYNEDKGTGFMRHAIVRVGHSSKEILVTLVTNGWDFPASRSFCRELVKRCPEITTVVQNINERQTNVILGPHEQRLYGPGFILDKLCGLSFRISSQSFYQVNSQQTEVLYQQAINLADLAGSETVIDAYCGTGTIGLVAAKNGAAQVIGVDTVESAIHDARENARHNGVDNARFVVEDAGVFMKYLAADKQSVDVLLMDPPRAGSNEEFLRSAVQLAPGRIVYISCNPVTQVRDLRFLGGHGYDVCVVQPVDMFPHTNHVEVICLLVKRDK